MLIGWTRAYIQLFSRFKRILKRIFRNASLLSLIQTRFFHLNVKENQHATKRGLLVEKQKDFSDQLKNVLIRSLKKSLSDDGCCRTKHRVTELHGSQTESSFLRFVTGCLISITGHLVSVKRSVNCVGTLSFCSGKDSFGFKKLLQLVWTLVDVFQWSMK